MIYFKTPEFTAGQEFPKTLYTLSCEIVDFFYQRRGMVQVLVFSDACQNLCVDEIIKLLTICWRTATAIAIAVAILSHGVVDPPRSCWQHYLDAGPPTFVFFRPLVYFFWSCSADTIQLLKLLQQGIPYTNNDTQHTQAHDDVSLISHQIACRRLPLGEFWHSEASAECVPLGLLH